MNIRKKVITLKLEPEFLELIGARAKKRYMSRADYIRMAVIEKIEQDNRDNNVNCLTSGGQSVTIP